MPERVLPPSSPDVLKAFRRRSPDDSAVGLSAPPGRPLRVTRSCFVRKSSLVVESSHTVRSVVMLEKLDPLMSPKVKMP